MFIARTLRRGSAAVAAVIMLLSIVILAALVVWLFIPFSPQPKNAAVAAPAEPLLVYCAASNKVVVEKIAAAYRAETGNEVQLQFGPSQTLLAQIEISGKGDLYLPADDSFLDQPREKGLTGETFSLGKMQGVLLVATGNPRKILAFDDLTREDVRLSQANPEAAAIGKLMREALLKANQWDRIAARSTFKTSVTDAANDVKLGAADAAIVWDVVAKQYAEAEAVELPELKPVTATVAVAVLSVSNQPENALRFARYLAAEDKGQVTYRAAGFAPAANNP